MASYLNLKNKTITLSKICLAATWKKKSISIESNQILLSLCVLCLSLPFYLSLSLSSFAHANLNKYPKQNITVLWWWIPCCVDIYSPDRHEVFKNDSLSHKRSCTFFVFFIFHFFFLSFTLTTLVFSVLFFFLLVKIRNLPTHQVTRTAWIYGEKPPLSNCMLLHSDY